MGKKDKSSKQRETDPDRALTLKKVECALAGVAPLRTSFYAPRPSPAESCARVMRVMQNGPPDHGTVGCDRDRECGAQPLGNFHILKSDMET